MKKFILWFLMILVVLGLGYWLYIKFFAQSKSIDAMACIPNDAIYIIETAEPIKSWKTISSSKPWQHIKTQKTFAEIGKAADELDQMISDHDILFNVFGDRKVFISAHKTKPADYDFLYIVDLQGAEKLNVIQQAIDMMCKLGGFKTKSRNFKQYKISENLDPETGETLYITVVNNQLICSYHPKLVESAITTSESPFFTSSEKFKMVSNRVSDKGLFKFYLNAAYYDDFMMCYQQPLDDINKDISNILQFAGMSFDMNDETLKMDGNINIHDSLDNYLVDMLKAGAGSLGNKKYITNDAAMTVSLGFDKFSDFYERLDKRMQLNDKDYSTVNKNVSLTENFLGITLRQNIISWIGDEVTYITLPPNDSVKSPDYAIVIHANSENDMVKNMDLITKRIKRRSLGLLKVEKEVYEDYTIKRMKVRGLFRKMFGKLFEKFDMPYYTMIDDRIIFTNTEYSMHKMIDDYKKENTLADNENYTKLEDQFNNSSSIFVYMNMEKYFPLLRTSMKPETFFKVSQNKKYITCFPLIGFQMTGNEKYYDVKLRSYFKEEKTEETHADSMTSEIKTDSIVNDSNKPDGEAYINNTQQEHYPNGNLKMESEMNEEKQRHGFYKEYWENGKIKTKGTYSNGAKRGIWKYYDENGEFLKKENFD